MNKRGMEIGIGTIVIFLIAVVVAVVIIGGFYSGYSKGKGVLDSIFDGVTKNWAGLREVFAEDKEVYECGDFADDELDQLKEKDKEKYVECLLENARNAFDILGDYEDAKYWYKKYINECKTLNLKCADLDEANKRIEKTSYVLERVASAEVDYQDATTFGSDIEKLKAFVEEYNNDSDIKPIKTALDLAERFIEEVSVIKETAKVEQVTETELKSMNQAELINYLKELDLKRESINEWKVRQTLPFIMESNHASDQIKAETLFLSLVLDLWGNDCDIALPIIRELTEKYKDFDFKYLQYSSPHFKSTSDSIDAPIEKISPTWIKSSILSEAELVRGWCAFREEDYDLALEAARNTASLDDSYRHDESSRYKLLRETAFKLVNPNGNCLRLYGEEACHKQTGEIILRGDKVTLEKGDFVTRSDIERNPTMGCYYNYAWANTCEPCIGREGNSPVRGCEDYETGLTGAWEKVCVTDPCAVSSTGCIVVKGDCIEGIE